MDSIYLKLVIIVLLLAIPSCFLYRSKSKDSPKYKQPKIYSNITCDIEDYYQDFSNTASGDDYTDHRFFNL